MVNLCFWKRKKPVVASASGGETSFEGLEEILWGIDKSPLPSGLKAEMKKKVFGETEKLRTALAKRVFSAPEVNLEGEITDYIMSLVAPLLQKEQIPQPYGRDTYRHIYQAIGGRNPLNYEIKVDYRRSLYEK